MEALILGLPLILVAFARVIEASALVILALRRDRPLRLGGESAAGGRLRLRPVLSSRRSANSAAKVEATTAERP